MQSSIEDLHPSFELQILEILVDEQHDQDKKPYIYVGVPVVIAPASGRLGRLLTLFTAWEDTHAALLLSRMKSGNLLSMPKHQRRKSQP